MEMKSYHIRWYKDQLQLEKFDNKNEIVINHAKEQGQELIELGMQICLSALVQL